MGEVTIETEVMIDAVKDVSCVNAAKSVFTGLSWRLTHTLSRSHVPAFHRRQCYNGNLIISGVVECD